MIDSDGGTRAWLAAGIAAGLVFGVARLAVAKLQCDPDRLHGRTHSIAIASFSIDGVATTVPSEAADAASVVKTELYDDPALVHLDAFDPEASPPLRKLHLSRVQ